MVHEVVVDETVVVLLFGEESKSGVVVLACHVGLFGLRAEALGLGLLSSGDVDVDLLKLSRGIVRLSGALDNQIVLLGLEGLGTDDVGRSGLVDCEDEVLHLDLSGRIVFTLISLRVGWASVI